MASHPDTIIDCSKVYVKKSTFSNEETGDFAGAFAAVPIKEGDLIEKGVMRRLPEGFDGNTCEYIFTWSTERPCPVSFTMTDQFFNASVLLIIHSRSLSFLCMFSLHPYSTSSPPILKTWGMGSGCAPFYNTCKEGTANTKMVRYFDEDRFEIFATRDIAADEELLHTYISLQWRKCFSDLNKIVHEEK